jgi:hypothetical protein
MTTLSLTVGLASPGQLPDQLPDNDRAVGCTSPDTPALSLSVSGSLSRGRAGFTPKRSARGPISAGAPRFASPFERQGAEAAQRPEKATDGGGWSVGHAWTAIRGLLIYARCEQACETGLEHGCDPWLGRR